jgi:hypothetical protein
MPVPALHILCAKLGCFGYDPAFEATGAIDLSPLNRTFFGTIWANDPRVGRVRHGFVSLGLEGPIWSFAGTLIPQGSFVEWLDDFDAVLVPSPYGPGLVHKGFLAFTETLSVVVDGVERSLPDAITANPQAVEGAVFSGHSLGTFPALAGALMAKTALPPVLIAPPKSGDTVFKDTCATVWPTIPSYHNPNDAVPRVPLTVDWPWKIEDFQQVSPLIELQPNLVTPSIPSDWASSHHEPNYLALMEAAP